MAAYAALVSLMNTIDHIMKHHLASLDNKQIQSHKDKAGFLLHFIEGYKYGVVSSKEFEDIESQIKSAAHTAEDMIELHIFNKILGRSADNGEASLSFHLYVQKEMAIEEHKEMGNEEKELTRVKKKKKVMDPVDQFHVGSMEAGLDCSRYLQQVIQDMDAIINETNGLKEKYALTKEEHLHHYPTHSTLTLVETETMVGFRKELFQLMDELTDHAPVATPSQS